MRRHPLARSVAAAGMLLALLVGAEASAQVDCSALPNPIYLQVGDTQEPLMKELRARAARRQSARQPRVRDLGLLYERRSDLHGRPDHEEPAVRPVDNRGLGVDGGKARARVGIAAGGHEVEVANSALFVSSCNPNPTGRCAPLPEPCRATASRHRSRAASAPSRSKRRTSSSASASRDGAAVDDELSMFIRTVTKSTLLAWPRPSPSPPTSGMVRASTSRRGQSALLAAPNPEQAIGILGAEVYDRQRDTLNSLAFRAKGQRRLLSRLDVDGASTSKTCAMVTTRCGRRPSGWTRPMARPSIATRATSPIHPGQRGHASRLRASTSPSRSASCPTARCA